MSAAELAELEGVLLLDVRSGAAGAQAYREGHLKGALHVDLDRDLSAPVTDPTRRASSTAQCRDLLCNAGAPGREPGQ